jgi:hypothetical protein
VAGGAWPVVSPMRALDVVPMKGTSSERILRLDERGHINTSLLVGTVRILFRKWTSKSTVVAAFARLTWRTPDPPWDSGDEKMWCDEERRRISRSWVA